MSRPTPIDLLDVIGNPVFAVQSAGDHYVLRHCNAAFRRVVNADDACLVGRPLRSFLTRRQVEKVEANYRRCRAPGDTVSYEEIMRLDSRESWWRTTLTAVDAGDPRAPLVIGTASDISAIKAREIQLTHDLATARQQNEELLTFAGLVAHDMRGPLGTVRTATQMALRNFRDHGDGKKELLEMCERTVGKCLSAIEDVMGQVDIRDLALRHDAVVDAGHVCRDIAAIVDPDKRLDIDVPTCCVRTDRSLLHLAVRNLMDNASRYATERVGISIATDRAAPDRIEVAVADDGPGLPPGFDLEAHVDPQRQVDSRKGGYGLRSVARLVRSRGGDITCEASGRGTTFRVQVPGQVLAS